MGIVGKPAFSKEIASFCVFWKSHVAFLKPFYEHAADTLREPNTFEMVFWPDVDVFLLYISTSREFSNSKQ
jgi:hypothetical protein